MIYYILSHFEIQQKYQKQMRIHVFKNHSAEQHGFN